MIDTPHGKFALVKSNYIVTKMYNSVKSILALNSDNPLS